MKDACRPCVIEFVIWAVFGISLFLGEERTRKFTTWVPLDVFVNYANPSLLL